MNFHSRAQIRLEKSTEIADFVETLSNLNTDNKFIIENFDGSYRVDARSYLGLMYASVEFGGEMFLVNLTKDGFIPFALDRFRS